MKETSISSSSVDGKYLTFVVSDERYGLEILKVQEIIKVVQITRVPKTPSYIKGVINLRGKIIPVVDLRVKFGIEPIPYDDRTCIIVINMSWQEQRLSVGVVVDTVLEVIHFFPNEVEPAPNYGDHLDSHFIIGMGKKEENLNILVDIDKIIGNQETVAMAATL